MWDGVVQAPGYFQSSLVMLGDTVRPIILKLLSILFLGVEREGYRQNVGL